jgi:hypothetical protein
MIFDLHLHFKDKLKPKTKNTSIATSLKIFFSRTVSARGEQKAVL